ncbi:hypothetical protein [Pseudophaeobacter sp.]|uniref:hypothetical protein n=1 Tax=Pseudophaeobacter sp. TaxID=1971739 RepID=UPI00329A7C72
MIGHFLTRSTLLFSLGLGEIRHFVWAVEGKLDQYSQLLIKHPMRLELFVFGFDLTGCNQVIFPQGDIPEVNVVQVKPAPRL